MWSPAHATACSADGMTALRFDTDALRERLGEKRFKRAEGYAERGWARIIAVESRRVSALVTGERGDVYGVEVDEGGDGLCTCPDFADTRACKHMGAVALTANGLEPTQTRLLNGRFARLRDTLAFEDAGALTEIVLNLAKRVPGVLEALEGEEDDPSG
jgi:uncharacterized Zn finger protein